MFTLITSLTSNDLTCRVNYGDKETEFLISSIVPKRRKSEVTEETQYLLLNAYVDYKGDNFKRELMDILYKANSDAYDCIRVNGISPLPYHIVHSILDYFNLDDVFHFLKNVYKLPVPNELANEFDEKIEIDARGTRVQTYLKDDYLELAALTLILKVASLPIFTYAAIKEQDLGTHFKEYILFNFISSHKPTFHSAPMKKVMGLIEMLINQENKTDDVGMIRVLEKRVPSDRLPYYYLAMLMLQKISVAPIVLRDNEKNLVKKIHNSVKGKLRPNADVAKAIRKKEALKDADGLPGDSESYVESHRLLYAHAPTDMVEFNWALESIEKIMLQLPAKQREYVKLDMLDEIKDYVKIYLKGNLLPFHIDILAIIFKSIIDPRCLDYIKIENLVNLVAIAFVYLWNTNNKHIALIFNSLAQQSEDNVEEVVINSTTNFTRIPEEIREELDFYYPYKRIINGEKAVNVAEETIGVLSDFILSQNWIPNSPPKYIEEVIGQQPYNKVVTTELKIHLAKFIISNEQNIVNYS